MKSKTIILIFVLFSPLIYYFEVTRDGNWDFGYLRDDVKRIFVQTYSPSQPIRTN
ncbi:MAG: hypothetical protein HOH18_01155 [Kordiimonadaceae bacterium]|jgi:hypothetical protein|nr:hypothetical protein [Kordiimonadaceae bacterium]MBT6035058.1 hypothetical protein [Kordiimonadaceae bacterium]